MDTGDLIRHKHTGDLHLVACVHPPHVYPIGWPSSPFRLDDVVLIAEALPDDRRMQIEALAASTGDGHRPKCARERLSQMDT